MKGLRIGKVIKVHYELNTVDVFMENGGGIMYNMPVVNPFAGSSVGVQELPILNTIAARGSRIMLATSEPVLTDNLFHLETSEPNKPNLDDPTANYCYAIVGMLDQEFGKIQPVCLGFVYPERNQMLFNPENPPSNISSVVHDAVEKLKGGYIHRTSSDVYWTVDRDGNLEWSHPNGSFFRIAETPNLTNGGVYHVDLTNANNKAQELDVNGNPTGNTTPSAWNATQKKGADGNLNSTRKLYGHFELNTNQGTVMLDIDRDTGNITIKTPVDESNATANNNQLTIIAGGNAIIESVQGNINIQSVNGNVTVESKNNVTIETDGATRNSIILASNAGSQDNLVFLHKLISKFNAHQHICNHTGSPSSAPLTSFDESDGTSVTIAG